MATIPALSMGEFSRDTLPGRQRSRFQYSKVCHWQYRCDGETEPQGLAIFSHPTQTWILADDQMAVCDCAVCVHRRRACRAGGTVVLGRPSGRGL